MAGYAPAYSPFGSIVHWARTGGNNYACHYCIDTGKLRGGTVEDCTVREAGKNFNPRSP